MTGSLATMDLRIDESPNGATPPGPLDVSGLCFSWLNTDGGSSGGTLRLVVSEAGGGLRVHGFGAGREVGEEPFDWGEVAATPLAQDAAGERAWAFTCRFDFGFMRTEIAAYGKEGILIAASFNAFADGDPRADYWTREFFHREGPR
jgi:hypothetical protein